MATKQTKAGSDTSLTGESKLNLFFYVKGSKDFPTGHLIDQRFGFAKSDGDDINDLTFDSETAVFNNTIKDIMTIVPHVREINNIYSLFSDNNNNIPPRGKSETRLDRQQEFISTMLISDAEKIKTIHPNYSYSNRTEVINSSIDVNKITLRESVFWQKVYTLLEYLKHEEANIINSQDKNTNPDFFTQNSTNPLWFGEPDTESNVRITEALKSEISSVGKYIGLFVGNGDFATNNENSGIPDNFYNPYRLNYTSGIDSITSIIDTKEHDEEIFWGKYGLNIQYVPKSAIFTRSQKENRISNIAFKLKYKIASEKTEFKIWDINVFFDPDEFVKVTAGEDLQVWTYNDIDLDSQYGDDSTNVAFNPLDNDYSNLLSSDNKVKGNFVVTQNELDKKIIDEIVAHCSKGYKFYEIFKTDRVTPFLEVVEDEKHPEGHHIIQWYKKDGSNVMQQKFYIFYRSASAKPSIGQCIKVVKDYLMGLHGHCQPTSYNDPEKEDVKFIGHGNDDNSVNEFLQKMYPNLFDAIELHLIPANYILCKNPQSSEVLFDPDSYYHSISLADIHLTISSIHEFNNIEFNTNGTPEIIGNLGSQKKYPVEILHIGGLDGPSTQKDDEGIYKFNFPWICTLRNSTLRRPLTTQRGFGDYKPKSFTLTETANLSAADILQLILIVLSEQMFIDRTGKQAYSEIVGIPIMYKTNTIDDENIGGNFNEAKFTINGVKFIVHSQFGKNFGSVTAPQKPYTGI